MQDGTSCADNAKDTKRKITTKRQKQRNCVIWKIDECCTSVSLNQWAQGSSPWRCTTTKSELFPIGEGFGFFVFFGKQNESIASPEKWSTGVCRPDSQWWPGGILEKWNREPQARNLNECWTVPFLSWCCPAFFWRWLTNFNGIFILLQFSLRLFYLFRANLYAHG